MQMAKDAKIPEFSLGGIPVNQPTSETSEMSETQATDNQLNKSSDDNSDLKRKLIPSTKNSQSEKH